MDAAAPIEPTRKGPVLRAENIIKGPVAMSTRVFALLIWLAALAGPPVFAQSQPSGLAKATFAAGCFWCTEEAMDKVPGVISTTSGYMGGSKKNPTYQEVSSGATGHTEVVQVVYDPKKVRYERLLE